MPTRVPTPRRSSTVREGVRAVASSGRNAQPLRAQRRFHSRAAGDRCRATVAVGVDARQGTGMPLALHGGVSAGTGALFAAERRPRT